MWDLVAYWADKPPASVTLANIYNILSAVFESKGGTVSTPTPQGNSQKGMATLADLFKEFPEGTIKGA